MVIIFQNEKALQQLLNKGTAYTFRTHEHLICNDYVTNKRGGKKIAEVKVTKVIPIKTIDENTLKPYVQESGFPTTEEWISAIKHFNPNIKEGYIWKVELIKGE